jgi:ribonuclease P protein component
MNLDFSFPKEQHLRRSKDIRWLMTSGRKYISPSMILYAAQVKDEPLKAGFVVSKRLGQATLRNRIKRLMREAFRTQKNLFEKGSWLVFVARSGVKDWNYSGLSEEMVRFSTKTKVKSV